VAKPTAKVLILSAHSDDEYIERMNKAGAVGFLEKQSPPEILIMAIHEVAKGRIFYSPSITKRLLDVKKRSLNRNGLPKEGGVRLTSRETEVLQLVAEGSANKQIEAKLGISIKTIEKHRQHVMDKLNIHDTAGLTRYAIAQGIIEATCNSPFSDECPLIPNPVIVNAVKNPAEGAPPVPAAIIQLDPSLRSG